VTSIRIPRHLSESGVGAPPQWRDWVDSLPDVTAAAAAEWGLVVGEPYEPGGRSAWIAPAVDRGGRPVVLKLGWRHFEAEHEAEALRLWDGDGAVRCLSSRVFNDTSALLLERCEPGAQLSSIVPAEEEQDIVITDMLRRLWTHGPGEETPFRPLSSLCAYWAKSLERKLDSDRHGSDRGLARDAMAVLRELPGSAQDRVLLCTDLHAENVLSARREPWLVIDPKPFVGDPAFDPVQHMLNCDRRLASDPGAMADRLAGLLQLDPERVRLWLFARCAQEGIDDVSLRETARRLAP
jgi:streptomycin 6-kinase